MRRVDMAMDTATGMIMGIRMITALDTSMTMAITATKATHMIMRTTTITHPRPARRLPAASPSASL